MPPAMIEIKDLSKCYVGRSRAPITALDGVSFNVEANEFVSVVGPSGCGKSTSLRIIAGLTPPSTGTVRVNGQDVTRPHESVGMVFQTPTLMRWRRVIDNVLLPPQILHLDMSGARARARELIALAGLQGFERCYPRELSGGMQQRVAICRALIHDPSLLLMDEPFGALDALTRDEMSGELLRIWSERKKTCLFITHSISEAVFLSDRVLVMTPRPGRIREIVAIPLPRPRVGGIKTSLAFTQLVDRIGKSLSQT